MFSLENIPASVDAFEVRTQGGAFCGMIVEKPAKLALDFCNGTVGTKTIPHHWKVYFNSNATRGSQIKFATAEAAIAFIRDRRIKKGWSV